MLKTGVVVYASGPVAATICLLDRDELPPIPIHEVRKAVQKAAADKAPGPDGIPNRVLHQCLPILEGYLTHLFNECMRISYCPKHFRQSTTVVLRKPGKK